MIILIVLLAALFLFGAILHSALVFAGFCVLLGISVGARFWVGRLARQVEIERQYIHRAFTGDEVQVTLIVKNRGRMSIPFIEVRENVPVELRTPLATQVLSLHGEEEQRIDYTLTCDRRGVFAIGPLEAWLGDVLGLTQRELASDAAEELIVYPRIVPLTQLELPTHSTLIALPVSNRLSEDTSRLMGVREYQSGDSPRRIHWTATARLNRLSVKQYQPAIARDTLICLDLDSGAYAASPQDAVERAIVVAASLANHIIAKEGLAVGIVAAMRDSFLDEIRRIEFPPRTGNVQLIRLLEALARVRPVAAGGLPLVLQERTHHLRWGTTVVAVTGEITAELAQSLLLLVRRGHPAAVIVVEPKQGQGSTLRWPRTIPIHRVWADHDLAALA